jgi:hypothetical protein
MDDIDKVLYPSIVTYILIMIIILLVKPKFLYDGKTNELRQFGIKKSQTLFALPIIGILASFIIYFLMVCYVFMMSRLK